MANGEDLPDTVGAVTTINVPLKRPAVQYGRSEITVSQQSIYGRTNTDIATALVRQDKRRVADLPDRKPPIPEKINPFNTVPVKIARTENPGHSTKVGGQS